MEPNLKMERLNALLLAITGSTGIEVLHDMGDESANAYLAACQALTNDRLTDVRVSQVHAA